VAKIAPSLWENVVQSACRNLAVRATTLHIVIFVQRTLLGVKMESVNAINTEVGQTVASILGTVTLFVMNAMAQMLLTACDV